MSRGGNPGLRYAILATAKKLNKLWNIQIKMASKAKKRREIIRKRREMIRKRSRTLFHKGYELHTKTNVQVAVITYDAIQNSYRVFRTSPTFMAANMRKMASLTLVANDNLF
jgi:hypothetical protein